MSYSWFRRGTCTVTNGSARVNFQGANITTSPIKPVEGDAFTIDNSDLYEAIFIGSDSTGEYIMLDRNFDQPSASNTKYAFMRLASSTQNAKLVAQAAAAINQKQISLDDMYEWYTTQSDEVDFEGPDGVAVTVVSYHKLAQDIITIGGHESEIDIVATNIESIKTAATNIGPIKAAPVAAQTATEKAAEAEASAIKAQSALILMTEAESQAIRNMNKEKYAASGLVHHGKHYRDTSTNNSINEGLYTSVTIANSLWSGVDGADESGMSKTKYPVTRIAGFVSNLLRINTPSATQGMNKILFPEAPKGDTTYDSATGAVVVHASVAEAFAAETDTNKVVTKRIDMFGLEQWLEEINDEIFPICIQNQSSTFGDTGIPTVLSTRPDSYFAVYNGQVGIKKGRCVKWSTLTDEQRKQVANHLGANLFVNSKGKMVQNCIVQDTKHGYGNGDWFNINPTNGSLLYKDGTPVFSRKGFAFVQDKESQGVFTDGNGSYYLVMGTVSRRSVSVQTPFNLTGTCVSTDGKPWFSTADKPTSLLECFTKATGGKIGTTSGASDGRFYDAIYADGLGGVVDCRLSAWGMSSAEEAGNITDKVIDKSYRGVEVYNGVSVSGDFTYTYEEAAGGTIELPRKCLQSSVECVHSSDNGATWNRTTPTVSNNAVTVPVGGKSVITFKTYAKQTKPSTAKSVYNGDSGVMPVLVTNSYEVSKGVLLNESVTGKIGKGTDYRNYRPLDYVMVGGMISDINTSMSVLPVDASEISCWQIVDNGQCSLMFYDGTNYHQLSIPYGYAQQKATAGEGDSKSSGILRRVTPNYYGTSYLN